MARTKKTTEPHYELLYIISNKFTEDEAKTIAEKIEALVTSNAGTVTYREDWGKKKLAYPIQHFAFGYYLYVEFDIEPLVVTKIERSIRLMHEVIRHQILTRPVRTIDLKEKPKVIFADEPKKGEPTKESETVKNISEKVAKIEEVTAGETAPLAETIKDEVIPAEKAEKSEKKTKVVKESKASMEELDAKLDKILETDDLI
jgi:small subunit ribosomal protein S6